MKTNIKILTIHPQCLIGLFVKSVQDMEYTTRVIFEDLPDDFEVESVVYDDYRQSWMIRVSHPTFPSLDVGQAPTILVGKVVSIKADIPSIGYLKAMKAAGKDIFGNLIDDTDWKMLYHQQKIAMAIAGIVDFDKYYQPIYRPETRWRKTKRLIRELFS